MAWINMALKDFNTTYGFSPLKVTETLEKTCMIHLVPLTCDLEAIM